MIESKGREDRLQPSPRLRLDKRSFKVTRLPRLFERPQEGQDGHCCQKYDEGQGNTHFQVVVESIPSGTHDKYIGGVGDRAGEACRSGHCDSHHGAVRRDA